MDDFKKVHTDHGVCFMFAPEESSVTETGECIRNVLRNVSRDKLTGSGNGLDLVLNVEGYEYMAGPHSATGIKILLIEDNGLPLVENLGDNLPTGLDSFVAVRPVKVYSNHAFMLPFLKVSYISE